MKTRPLAMSVLAAVFLGAGPSAFAQVKEPPPKKSEVRGSKVDLRPRYKAGQVNRFKLELQTNGTQSTSELGEQKQSTSQEIGIALKVKSADKDAGATLELVYESIKLRLKPPGGGDDIEFDSTKKADGDDPIAAILRPIVGLTLTVKADKDGNITSVDGGGGLAGAAAGISGQFTGADVIKNLVGPIVSIRRGSGEAAVGESWSNEDIIDAPWGKVKMTTTNTLKSHRAGVADIEIRGVFALDSKSGTVPIPSIKDSSLSGTAHWNTETGMLTDMNVRQKLSMEGGTEGKSVREMNLKVTTVK